MVSKAQQSISLDIGRVTSGALQALKSQFLTVVVLALLLVGIPSFFLEWLVQSVSADPNQVLATFVSSTFWLTFLATMVMGSLLQAAVMKASISVMRGERIEIGQAVLESLKLILPLFVLNFIVFVGMTLGLILLIVPGVILYLMWIVAVPVLVDEQPGILGSLSRSAELTKGSRGSIFLLFLIYGVAAIIVSALSSLVNGIFGFTADSGPTALSLIVSVTFGLALSLATATVLASLYFELRLIKDGGTHTGLTEIFS
jgi:hypothetical protein